MGCGSSSADRDDGIPEGTVVMVIGESPHKGRTGTVKVAGAKKTVVTFMDKIDSDEELSLKTSCVHTRSAVACAGLFSDRLRVVAGC